MDYYGANPASYGLFSVLLYVWACFANIYIGQIIDSVQILPGVFPPEKWGRRAPWILILLPLYFIVTFLAFNPSISGKMQLGSIATACTAAAVLPENSTAPTCAELKAAASSGANNEFKVGNIEIYFFVIFLCFVHIQNGLYQAFFSALPEIYQNPHERGQVGAYLGVFGNMNALLIVLAIAFVFMGETVNGTGIFLLCAVFLFVFSYPGLMQLKKAKFKQKNMGSLITNLQSICKSHALRVFLCSQLFHNMSNIGTLVLFIFWLTRVAGMCITDASTFVGLAGLSRLVVGMFSIPCWNWLLTKKNIHPRITVAAAYVITSIVNALLLQTKNPSLVLVTAAFLGIVYAQNNLSNRMFVGWCVDDDTRIRFKEDGVVVRREALILGTVSMLANIAYFWGGILLSWMAATGYEGTLPTECLPKTSTDFIHFAFSVLTPFIGLLRGIVIFFFPIRGESFRQLEQELFEINKKSEIYKDTADSTVTSIESVQQAEKTTVINKAGDA